MKSTIRDQIIEKAAELILKNGYHHTGIMQILSSIQVPKGSFYHYFKSKEDMGYAVIKKATVDNLQNFNNFFNSITGSSLKKMQAFFESIIEMHKKKIFPYGCLIGNMAQELAEQHEGFRKAIQEAFKAIENFFAEYIYKAQEEGELRRDIEPEKMAGYIYSSWQGAILAAKVNKSFKPLYTFVEYLFTNLLK